MSASISTPVVYSPSLAAQAAQPAICDSFPTSSGVTAASSATSLGFLTRVKWNLAGFSFRGTSLDTLFVVPCRILFSVCFETTNKQKLVSPRMKPTSTNYLRQSCVFVLEEILTMLLASTVSTLVSAVSLCLEPGYSQSKKSWK